MTKSTRLARSADLDALELSELDSSRFAGETAQRLGVPVHFDPPKRRRLLGAIQERRADRVLAGLGRSGQIVGDLRPRKLARREIGGDSEYDQEVEVACEVAEATSHPLLLL